MNTHLKQLWAAMKLPKNFKKSYKFFCLGLDIRVAKVLNQIFSNKIIAKLGYTSMLDYYLVVYEN